MVLDTTLSLVEPSQNMKIDESSLQSYIGQHVPSIHVEGLRVFQFSHGQSNPTYLLQTSAGRNYVLRKKPPPPTLPSAHAIEREFKVLQALNQTSVPVPRVLTLCEDSSIIGTPFYIMQHVQGRIFDDPSLPSLSPAQRSTIYQGMAKTLAALHNVIPAHINLSQYGKPSGYNRRQVQRWTMQYYRSVEATHSIPMREMVKLIENLQHRIPASDTQTETTRISHGDFRLDNLVYDVSRDGVVLAVLDWELSTLGDPLADLAYNCLPYHLPSDIPSMVTLPSPLPPGIPTEQLYIKLYCQSRNIPYPLQADWGFYLALSIFRLASILAGVGARAKQGNASSRVAAAMGADSVVRSLASRALEILDSITDTDISTTTTTASLQNNNSSGSGSSTTSVPVLSLGLNPSPRAAALVNKLTHFMHTHIYPAESQLNAHAMSTTTNRWTIHPLQEELKHEAQRQGLWNLWLPADMAASLKDLVHSVATSKQEASLLLGPGLTNLEYAHCAEVMGASVWAPECFNCSAPDTGNMEVLARYGSREQQQQWLIGLLRGEYRSCFAMTEPAVASSDATNIQSSIERQHNGNGGSGSSDDEVYVLNGRKWWISGACDPRCKVAIFMGKSDTSAATHNQQSMVLVPMNTAGVTVVRPLPVFGFDDAPHGHAEMLFTNVTVPTSNIILGEGRGFEIAQGRLGPGRLHHCMRLIGLGERAIQLMLQRAGSRKAFGSVLGSHQSVRLDIAHSRIELDAARLVVLNAAHALDFAGNKEARGQIAEAKALAPTAVLKIIDRAIQMHGGAGVGDTTPLAHMYATARTLRLADGPDVVHLETIAKMELVGYRRSKM